MSFKDLPSDRLATSDRKGNRIYLYPTDVRGKWKKLRSRVSIFLIALFLGLPWVKVGGHQALLLDILHRRFAIFGLTFWAHDAPLLFFILVGVVLVIGFVTAIWGRVWCGWACPQTVFVEQVFRRIERWIEGDSLAQKKLDDSPLSPTKLYKKVAKWSAFLFIALILSHSFLAYFVGTEAVGQMMKESPTQNMGSFLLMIGIAAGILFDFGWFREQFCTIVCPYGRFQSVLMDNQSTVVAYDGSRSDCVNCYRCVRVCPTGIDIRKGVQLECIACTACIDACDDVMSRLKKPKGLIRYENPKLSSRLLRPRAWIYLGLILGCLFGLIFTVSQRSPLELTLIRANDFPYQEIPGPLGKTQILNHFKVDLRNQTFEEQEVTFSITPELQAQGVTLLIANHKTKLNPGEPERADLFIQFPILILKNGRAVLPIHLQAQGISLIREATLVGPFR